MREDKAALEAELLAAGRRGNPAVFDRLVAGNRRKPSANRADGMEEQTGEVEITLLERPPS
jgi:hypothetical protein